MRHFTRFLALFALLIAPLKADDQFFDYQSYNHNHCPDCNNAPCVCGEPEAAVIAYECKEVCQVQRSCDPSVPVRGTDCSLSVFAIAIAIAAVAAVGVLVVTQKHKG